MLEKKYMSELSDVKKSILLKKKTEYPQKKYFSQLGLPIFLKITAR